MSYLSDSSISGTLFPHNQLWVELMYIWKIFLLTSFFPNSSMWCSMLLDLWVFQVWRSVWIAGHQCKSRILILFLLFLENIYVICNIKMHYSLDQNFELYHRFNIFQQFTSLWTLLQARRSSKLLSLSHRLWSAIWTQKMFCAWIRYSDRLLVLWI